MHKTFFSLVITIVWIFVECFSDADDQGSRPSVTTGISELQEQMQVMMRMIGEINEKLLEQDRQISVLRDRLSSCESKCAVNEDYNEGRVLHSNIKKRAENWTLEYEGPVVFTAYLGHTLNGVSRDHVIPFDHVTLSEGVSYNGSDGVFVCPREGLYLFLFHIMVDARRHATVALKVNGQAKSWTSAGGIVETQSEGAGNSVIVKLAKGDHVWIAMDENHGHLNSARTSFTGIWISY